MEIQDMALQRLSVELSVYMHLNSLSIWDPVLVFQLWAVYSYLDSSACICRAMALGWDISVTSEIIGPPVIVLLVEQEAASVDGWETEIKYIICIFY